jgi:tRNA (pseudouridine54-N1)-methyltransferase
VRYFVVVGQNATATGDFLLQDLPGTSGRLDIGLRCVRAALLLSHGVRRDVVVYLVLRGGPRAPRVLRFDGARAHFIRPDERSLAVLAKKVLASAVDASARGFVETRVGVAVANGGIEEVLADVGAVAAYVLEEDGPDLRGVAGLESAHGAFFLGDHIGFDEATRAQLAAVGAHPLGVGPISLHAEDAIAIVSNELDRRDAQQRKRVALTSDTP